MIASNQHQKYPDAKTVLRAFAGVGRRHLFVTGGRGSGKSTLLRALHRTLGGPAVTTTAIPGTSVVMTDEQTKQTAVVGVYDPTLSGKERKMRPMSDGFSAFGCALLHRCMQSPSEWVCIDEIGYLEGECPSYLSVLEELLAKKRVLAAIRREELVHLTALLQRDDAFVLDLDRPYGDIGCVIMASGMGVRFGGNKLMADFGGMPMIARVLAATDGIFARRVVVTRHADVKAFCQARGVDVVMHDLPDRNDTVRLGLEAVGNVSACMFCPSDQPLLTNASVRALAMAAAADPQSLFRASWEDTVGAPVVFAAWTFDALRSLPKGKGGGYVLKQHPQCVKTVAVSTPDELADVDTREALHTLLQKETDGK